MCKFIISFCCYVFFILTLAAQDKAPYYTVIVSLDALRRDYPAMYDTPNLNQMAREGAKATMLPPYPTFTFPNHYTPATGLMSDYNGIINNTFWDVKRHRQYFIGDPATRNNLGYYLGEPIWIMAQKQGVKAGNIYWVGSDTAIRGGYPTYYWEYAEKPRLTFEQRIDSTIALLRKSEAERPCFVMLYFEEPDGVTHHHGPRSVEATAIVHHMDSLIGMLRQGIISLPFGRDVNLIVTADHGMTEISDDRVVDMNKCLCPEWCEAADGRTPTSIFTEPEYRDSVYHALKDVSHIYVWEKEETPAELNYGSSDRIGDTAVAPELGWQFTDVPRALKGVHGRFPQSSDMQIIFHACGLDFKAGYESKGLVNVDIHPLLVHLLKITPEKTDGQFERIKDILKDVSLR